MYSLTRLTKNLSRTPLKHIQKKPCQFSTINKKFYCSKKVTDKPAIVQSLLQSLKEEEITQESMLLKLDDLVPLPDTFAVVQIGGKQYKITKDDEIMIDKIDVPIQTQILLDKVLLVGSADYTVVGQPILTNAKVLAEVEEHDKTEKVIIFKKKRRKGYKRRTGHRQPYTLLRIIDIMSKKDTN